jgi:hydrazine synthase alpha subunit-like protein/WD40 repeat protein
LLSVISHYENVIFASRAVVMRGLVAASALALAGCLAGTGSGGEATDPVAVENPVVFVKRPLLFDEDNGMLIGDNLAEPAEFRPGARLYLKGRAAPEAPSEDITSRAFPDGATYDVKDLSVSFDGTRVVFAMRAPEIDGADEEDQPTWNLWEYDLTANSLARLISSDVTAEEGQDIAPAYLPDGRIVFSSTRQTISKGILLDENLGKPQFSGLDEEREVPAFVLHVFDPDLQSVNQITFNQSHDLDPLVQDDGTIVFSRWDNAGQTANNGFNLYRVNPDGTGLTYLYGRHSHDSVSGDTSVEYLRPRLTDDGRILTQLRPLETDNFSAIPSTVNTAEFVEADLAIDGSQGSGQTPLVSGLSVGDGISLSGNYGSISPLLDGSNRYLVSWSPCRLRLTGGDGTIINCTSERVASGSYESAQPAYGLWLLDTGSGTQRPIEPADEGQQFDEAVLVRQRSLPDFIPEAQYSGDDGTRADNGFGVIEIRSVYDLDGVDISPQGIAQTADPGQFPPDNLPRRFLRIEKPVSIPGEEVRDFDNTAFGRSQAQSMREIMGYVPIEPDGSVRVRVPANVAFAISVLDDEGQRIGPRHQNWLNLRPGETVTCNGCHNPNSDVPHGRPDAAPASVYDGAPTTGIPFPNTDSALFTDMGETMAETWARVNGTRVLAPNLVYEDQWTDPNMATPGQSFTLSYAGLETPSPILPECEPSTDPAINTWTVACRIVVNYEQHVHPLWDLPRQVEVNAVPTDVTCTGCHTNTDAGGADRIPDGQLDLTNGASDQEPDHFKAYRELLVNDNRQILEGGLLVDEQRETGEFLRDEEGNLILDPPETGEPIPILEPVNVPATMSVNGARASNEFFDLFRSGGAHEGYLSPDELRLLSEWLDIGGQYYNNPFAIVAD